MASRPVIIVPIYNAAALLADCLRSLQQTLGPEDHVLLIDDASTEIGIANIINNFVREAGFSVQVERNATNRGFVQTVNRGMAIVNHNMLLLNSDTLVTRGWLDRMSAALASDPFIATVTPFSNNAEICSFPEFCVSNPLPTDPNFIAAALGSLNPQYPDLPTAVGFCMLIRRKTIDQIGDFDAATFGRGYGEENDFCMRATRHGWRHVLCDDAYVVHRGRGSFALTGEQPGGAALAKLSARYPGYNALVADFIRRDPLASIRQAALAKLSAPY